MYKSIILLKTKFRQSQNLLKITFSSVENCSKAENDKLFEEINKKFFSKNFDGPEKSSSPSEKGDIPPQPPKTPTNCCGGGCPDCVFDEYFVKLKTYEEKMAEWKKYH